MKTPRQIIKQAFNYIGIAPYDYDLSADQYESALDTFRSMLDSWNLAGLPYNLSNIDGDSEIPAFALSAVYKKLAIDLSTQYGKVITPQMSQQAGYDYRMMISNDSIIQIPKKKFPANIPLGAGNQWNSDRRWSKETTDKEENNCDNCNE